MSIYPRPEFTEGDRKKAEAYATAAIKKYGLKNFCKLLALIALENIRLTRECNEHRTARGFEPLELHEV